jgi:hypothetical protein
MLVEFDPQLVGVLFVAREFSAPGRPPMRLPGSIEWSIAASATGR